MSRKGEEKSKFITRTIRLTAEDLEYLTQMFSREYSLDFTGGLRVLLRRVIRRDQRIEEARAAGTLQTVLTTEEA